MKTPRANRLHIGIYGRRNAGKSTLINMLTGQKAALVSDTPGTTADPVYKSMELSPIGPVVFIDTAGYDDEGDLGNLRVEKTEDTLTKADVAILVINGEEDPLDLLWARRIEELGIPLVRFKRGQSIEKLREDIVAALPENMVREKILGELIEDGGLALLVMPQDIQAPKGRLILPQVQTLRELLDKRCTAVVTTADGLERSLGLLKSPPELIITDSQCFEQVYKLKPAQSRLTSFSVLFAACKGDIKKFTNGALAIDDIIAKVKADKSFVPRILIAEACAHVPTGEDIGTVKIPAALRKAIPGQVEIINIRGNDFPKGEALLEYDLIIHCGACMFNRRHVLSRIGEACDRGIPITNYGIALAKLAGILDKIEIPS